MLIESLTTLKNLMSQIKESGEAITYEGLNLLNVSIKQLEGIDLETDPIDCDALDSFFMLLGTTCGFLPDRYACNLELYGNEAKIQVMLYRGIGRPVTSRHFPTCVGVARAEQLLPMRLGAFTHMNGA